MTYFSEHICLKRETIELKQAPTDGQPRPDPEGFGSRGCYCMKDLSLMDVVKDVGACGLCLVNHRVPTSYSVPWPRQTPPWASHGGLTVYF